MDVEGDAPIRLMTSDKQQTMQTVYKQNKHLTLNVPGPDLGEVPTSSNLGTFEPWKVHGLKNNIKTSEVTYMYIGMYGDLPHRLIT